MKINANNRMNESVVSTSPFEMLHIKLEELEFNLKDFIYLSNITYLGAHIWMQSEHSFYMLDKLNATGLQSISYAFYERPIEVQTILPILIKKFVKNLRIGDDEYWSQKVNGEVVLRLDEYHMELKQLMISLAEFCPEMKLDFKLSTKEEEMMQKIITDEYAHSKQPNRFQKLYAIQQFCPELITKLLRTDKETQGKVLYLITGANKDDCYKTLFTAKVSNLKGIDKSDVDFLLTKL
jgi:hypothetical protein